jgi:hypothetical protein
VNSKKSFKKRENSFKEIYVGNLDSTEDKLIHVGGQSPTRLSSSSEEAPNQ